MVLNVVTAMPPYRERSSRFSEVRTLFNGKGSIVEIPLYAIDNTELHDYVDHWLDALRIASEHAVVMRNKPAPVATLGRHGSSFDLEPSLSPPLAGGEEVGLLCAAAVRSGGRGAKAVPSCRSLTSALGRSCRPRWRPGACGWTRLGA